MTVWVVLSASAVRDKISEAVDGGDIASAIRLTSSLNAFIDKLKNFCQSNGGSLVLALYERCIMSLPVTAAEQVPVLVQDYSTDLHGGLAVGVGMNVFEATCAAKMSCWTKEIELYDPAKDYDVVMAKDESFVNATPNIFDPMIPGEANKAKMNPVENQFEPAKTYMKQKPARKVPALSPNAEASTKLSNQLIQSTMAEVGFNPQPPMQQQGAQSQPRDLLESLNGGQIQGYQPPEPDQEKGSQPKAGQQELKSGQSEEQLTSAIDQAEQEAQATNKKLAVLLANVREQVPALMQLHDTNPKAFKQAMTVVSKLIGLASQRQRTTKSETLDQASEELAKALRRRSSGYHAPAGGRKVHSYPIGTRIGRKRKVLVNGKAVWRQMATGQVKSAGGSPISVIESNSNKEQKEE